MLLAMLLAVDKVMCAIEVLDKFTVSAQFEIEQIKYYFEQNVILHPKKTLIVHASLSLCVLKIV